MQEYAYLFLVATILQGQDIRDIKIETVLATDLASCEELRAEWKERLEVRAETEERLIWHVGKCLTESPFSHSPSRKYRSN